MNDNSASNRAECAELLLKARELARREDNGLLNYLFDMALTELLRDTQAVRKLADM